MCRSEKSAEIQTVLRSSVLRSKVCQGVKCVKKKSELGCKVYHATLKQSFDFVPKEQSVRHPNIIALSIHAMP